MNNIFYNAYIFKDRELTGLSEVQDAIEHAYAVSQTFSACVERLSMFIFGGGFDGPAALFNEQLQQIAWGLAKHGALCLLISRDEEKRVLGFTPVPLSTFRLKFNKKGEPVAGVQLHPDSTRTVLPLWGFEESSEVDYTSDDIFLYAGVNMDSFNGYAEPPGLQVVIDAIAEHEIKKSLLRDIRFGFAPEVVIIEYSDNANGITGGDIYQDEPREDPTVVYSSFAGSEAAKIIHITYRDPMLKPEVVPIEKKDAGANYQVSLELLKQNIMRKFGIPQILFGIPTAGKLGDTQEIRQAIEYTEQYVVRKYRDLIEKNLTLALEGTVIQEMLKTSFRIKNVYGDSKKDAYDHSENLFAKSL